MTDLTLWIRTKELTRRHLRTKARKIADTMPPDVHEAPMEAGTVVTRVESTAYKGYLTGRNCFTDW